MWKVSIGMPPRQGETFRQGDKLPGMQPVSPPAFKQMSSVPAFEAAQALQGRAQILHSLRFAGAIHQDYSMEMRGSTPLNARTVSRLQQGLLARDLLKPDPDTSLKLYLGPLAADGYADPDQAALADVMTLLNRPVDVVLTSGGTPETLRTLLSATGKRFIYPGAVLSMYAGQAVGRGGYNKNKDLQVDRVLSNAYMQDLVDLVMERTGKAGPKTVYRDLMSNREYSALKALSYGQKGLVDGILYQHDRVITREDLERFYQHKGWHPRRNTKAIETFLQDYMNVYAVGQVSSTPLATFSPDSLPKAATPSTYTSLADLYERENTTEETTKGQETVNASQAKEKPPTFYVFGSKGVSKATDLPLNGRVSGDVRHTRMAVSGAPWRRNILQDDVIFFNDAFDDDTAAQIANALLALDEKKQREETPSHIKILENSPGGSVWSGQELRSVIRSLRTPVDVIVQGMGASCGSWLLCSATGNRFATPGARIMIHEAAMEPGMSTTPAYNEDLDSLNQSTRNYVQIVADTCERPFDAVWQDFKLDVWFNPLEALFYGNKGLIDGILVGPDKVITRKQVERYLINRLGDRKAMQEYVEANLARKREPTKREQPRIPAQKDPFAFPVQTLAELSASAQNLGRLKAFKGSMPEPSEDSRTLDFYNVQSSEWGTESSPEEGLAKPGRKKGLSR